MKPETLEALSIDRALGELPGPVAELFDTYLAQNPAAAATAAAWSRTWRTVRQTARAAASPGEHLPEPAFLRRAAWRGWLAEHRGELARLAACLALGLGLGWVARPGSHAPARPPPDLTGQPAVPRAESTASAPVAAASHFWSVARLAAHHRAADDRTASPPRYRVRWDSPARLPSVEEKQ